MVSIKGLFLLGFVITLFAGAIAFLYGLGHRALTILSAPWTPQEQFLQTLSSDGTLIEAGFVAGVIGGIGVYIVRRIKD